MAKKKREAKGGIPAKVDVAYNEDAQMLSVIDAWYRVYKRLEDGKKKGFETSQDKLRDLVRRVGVGIAKDSEEQKKITKDIEKILLEISVKLGGLREVSSVMLKAQEVFFTSLQLFLDRSSDDIFQRSIVKQEGRVQKGGELVVTGELVRDEKLLVLESIDRVLQTFLRAFLVFGREVVSGRKEELQRDRVLEFLDSDKEDVIVEDVESGEIQDSDEDVAGAKKGGSFLDRLFRDSTLMRAILTPIRPITDTFMRVLGTNLFKDVLGFTKESLGGLFDFLGKQRAEKKEEFEKKTDEKSVVGAVQTFMPVPYTRAEYQKEKYQRESVEFDTAGDDAGDAVIVSGEIGEKQDDSKFDIKTLAIVAGIAVILSNFQKLVDGFSAFLDDVALLWDDITQPFNAVRKFFGFGRDSDTQKRDSKRRVAEKDRIYEMEKRALEGSAEWADKKIKRLEEKLDEADDADEREDIEESISRYERKKDRMLGKFKKRWSDRYAGDSGEVEKQDQESRSSLNEKVEGDKAKEERAFRGGVPIGMPTRISAELEGTEGVSQALKDNTEVMSKLTAVLNRKEERVVQSRGKKMQDDIDYNMRKGFNVGLL